MANGNGHGVLLPNPDDETDVALDVLEPEAPEAWERQPDETLKAYHAFCHFRDLKIRSRRNAYVEHKRQCEGVLIPPAVGLGAPKRWNIWSAQNHWQDRVRAYDTELEREVRAKLVKQQVEARERHGRLAQATLTTLAMPVKAILEASQDPAFMANLTAVVKKPQAALGLIRDIGRLALAIPQMVNVERLALGLATESVEIAEKTDDLDAVLAQRIVEDPAATDLAIQLLHRVAHAGSGAALGAGPLGLQGHVVPDAAPEPPDEEAG